MPVRSSQLWTFTGNANVIKRSPVVPIGHVWVVKMGFAINNTGLNNIDVALGITMAAGWDLALAENVSTPSGGTVNTGVIFACLVAGDALFFKTNNNGTCRVMFSGADLS